MMEALTMYTILPMSLNPLAAAVIAAAVGISYLYL
jgi:hypothetical protein